MPRKEEHLLVDGSKKKCKLTLNMSKLAKFLLHFGWCINTSSHYRDTGVLPERKECNQGFPHEANGAFKTDGLMAAIGEN